MEKFLAQHPTETVFVLITLAYALLIGFVTYWNSRSKHPVAHENFPKTVKHITEGFVSIIVFMMLYYLAMNNILSKDVLITLVSVFATAGFINFTNK